MSRRYKRPDSLKHKRRRALREFHQKFRLLLKHRENQPVPNFAKEEHGDEHGIFALDMDGIVPSVSSYSGIFFDDEPDTFDGWKAQLIMLAGKEYGMSLNDFDADDETIKQLMSNGETPREYMDYIAEKYELKPINE